mgnify:CR=1 FL=1
MNNVRSKKEVMLDSRCVDMIDELVYDLHFHAMCDKKDFVDSDDLQNYLIKYACKSLRQKYKIVKLEKSNFVNCTDNAKSILQKIRDDKFYTIICKEEEN